MRGDQSRVAKQPHSVLASTTFVSQVGVPIFVISGAIRCLDYMVDFGWVRRCQDKKGKFTVETTAWEDVPEAGNSKMAQEAPVSVHEDSRKPNPEADKIKSP